MVQALAWVGEDDGGPAIRLLDQRVLPAEERPLDVRTVDDLVEAIRTLAVRGAPALGAVGALGVALAMRQSDQESWSPAELDAAIDRIGTARPTAVNLAWGVAQVRDLVPHGHEAVLGRALEIVAEDEAANRRLSRLGADWILRRTAGQRRTRLRVLTHCNTGALATTGWGTAYGIIHELWDRERLELVYADETRPLLQGARLTSWELMADGIPHLILCDGAAAGTILRGSVDVAVIGADRIAANGDTANKVGSVGVALACARAGIPFVVAAPSSTLDLATPDGRAIGIEDRDPQEVLQLGSTRTAPDGARASNPAFDVTPADLVSAVVTEHGVCEPASDPDPQVVRSVAG